MIDRRLTAYRALASESRVGILHVLQERGAPVPVDEVAAAVGLHVNTAREHLDRLVASGFVEREAEVRTTRGRPRMLYRSIDRAAAATVDARAREHLARLLVDGYGRALECPGESAQDAGFRWADELAGRPRTGSSASRPQTADAAERAVVPGPRPADASEQGGAGGATPEAWDQLAALEQHFEDLGFQPEADTAQLQIHLRRCPFYDLARTRTEVVCGVHLGLARGVLAHERGPLVADRLEPFVGPRHCVLHLARA